MTKPTCSLRGDAFGHDHASPVRETRHAPLPSAASVALLPWRDPVLSFDFNGKAFEAKIKIRAAAYEGTTVSYDVRLISGELAECFDNPRMVFEAMKVASSSAAATLR